MTSKLGSFIARYHGLGDGVTAVAGFTVKVAAVQKYFLLQF
jgi:hypothetical protein